VITDPRDAAIAPREPENLSHCLVSDLHRFDHGRLAMALFIAGFATGVFVSIYLLVGTDQQERSRGGDAAQDHAEKWKDQRPLPPF
jgi:hypothetical protein